MKRTLLAGMFGLVIAGAAPAALMAQATQPLQQPNSEAAAAVPAGTYKVRLTQQEATSKAPGATAAYERYVEFVQGTEVKGREVVSIVPSADIGKVAKGKGPAPGASRVEKLRGDDYVRVWINRGGNHYLIHLVAG